MRKEDDPFDVVDVEVKAGWFWVTVLALALGCGWVVFALAQLMLPRW